jgi:hypothetical protein
MSTTTRRSTATATTATATPPSDIRALYLAFRRLEQRINWLRVSDPHSGELHARGELQRAHDAALAALRAAADPIIDAERGE